LPVSDQGPDLLSPTPDGGPPPLGEEVVGHPVSPSEHHDVSPFHHPFDPPVVLTGCRFDGVG
jgi:hypothetical protein